MATSYINYFPVSSVIKVVQKTGSIPAGTSAETITADTLDDYTFVCWTSAFATNGATTLTIQTPMSAESDLYCPSSAQSVNITYVVLALYVHK